MSEKMPTSPGASHGRGDVTGGGRSWEGSSQVILGIESIPGAGKVLLDESIGRFRG